MFLLCSEYTDKICIFFKGGGGGSRESYLCFYYVVSIQIRYVL